MSFKKNLFLLFFFISGIFIGQEIPPILKFQPEDYRSENQNWAITQNKNKTIFVANNEGLLEFNGARWTLNPSSNSTVIRSLFADEDKIYSGAYMEFGFWRKDQKGILNYKSISKKIENELFEDENIWNIKKYQKWILFQSFHRIYFYNIETEEINYLTDFNNYYRIFEIDAVIYIFKQDGTLVKLENGKEVLITKFPDDYNVKLVLNLFKIDNNYLVLTRSEGFFLIENDVVSKWDAPVNKEFTKDQIFCGIRLRDNSFMLGTISNGVLHISSKGEVINRIDQTVGLTNNTVLYLYEDVDGNVWSALDNGINCLNNQSFIKEFNDDDGHFGTTYCSLSFEDKIYIGTNQGLFYKAINTNEPLKKVSGITGQIWSLFATNGDLLCGHTSGTYQIKNNSALKITDFSGTWNFREIPEKSNLILQGHYSGMSILEKKNDVWQLKNKLKGFQNSARFFELINPKEIFVNHEYKGVYKLVFDDDYQKFKENILLSSIEKGKGSGLTKYDDDLLYSYKKGVFKLQTSTNTFKKDSVFSSLFSSDEYVSGKLISDKNNKLWSFNKSTISYLEKGPIENKYSLNFIPVQSYLRKTTVSFESISNVYNNHYLIGKTNGYLLLDLDKKQDFAHKIYLNTILLNNVDTLEINLQKSGDFKANQNSIEFQFSSPVYNKYQFINYQYKINDNNWIDLGSSSYLKFENLSFGTYKISLRSVIANHFSENTITYNFRINPPIYFTTTAIVLYVLLFLSVVFFVHKLYKKDYRKRHKKLVEHNFRQLEVQKIKTDQEVIKLTNEKLSQEIESKNRELAISTMSIIKRNEFLRSIKKELKQNPQIDDSNPIYKLIEKNLNSTKDWDFFKEAFNNADKDFLKRAKKLHPDLTHNNLKFCAYLRLNLTSKEIAPLLNISVKSVEIRRYRLRKKLNLSSKTNLTDYILSI
ncbi:LuxR C-terminal-related transcriptional regulator [Polaribacter sp. Hel_I_88]|uniref:helix-turn-helix and ligand-binding sensor domain-containing protein n=1 Tax=Polaribacter sp. Hel_I_88 TaxID=1250006 RepID=UPI00047AE5F7|nr:LuxR C-terminal-related transcriptional regulator [Polaribacter sp. Hel_I_88]